LVGNFSGESDFLEQKECLAANPRIYGQLVGTIGKFSRFASAGDKAAVRQARGKSVANAVEDLDAPKTTETPDLPKPTGSSSAETAPSSPPF
jgi:myo-inositol-1(or 4)-monophosphatase